MRHSNGKSVIALFVFILSIIIGTSFIPPVKSSKQDNVNFSKYHGKKITAMYNCDNCTIYTGFRVIMVLDNRDTVVLESPKKRMNIYSSSL